MCYSGDEVSEHLNPWPLESQISSAGDLTEDVISGESFGSGAVGDSSSPGRFLRDLWHGRYLVSIATPELFFVNKPAANSLGI